VSPTAHNPTLPRLECRAGAVVEAISLAKAPPTDGGVHWSDRNGFCARAPT